MKNTALGLLFHILAKLKVIHTEESGEIQKSKSPSCLRQLHTQSERVEK